MAQVYQVATDDPWYVDQFDAVAVMQAVLAHCESSLHCTHGHGFTYDFCPIANGNLKMAIQAAK